jgi:hypothetical protein
MLQAFNQVLIGPKNVNKPRQNDGVNSTALLKPVLAYF